MNPTLEPGTAPAPFAGFYQPLETSPLRRRISESYRLPEPVAVQALLPLARQNAAQATDTQALARKLALNLRHQNPALGRAGLVQGLLREFAL